MGNDIYITLLKDLIHEYSKDDKTYPIDIENTNSLFNDLNRTAFKQSVEKFSEILKKPFEGEINLDNRTLVEPCPIAYTGKLGEKTKFRTIFLALNPHYEPPRIIEKIETWQDLAYYHHPDDIPDDIPDVKKKLFQENNMYRRVFGHMETNKNNNGWNPFYKYVFCLHMSLHKDKSFSTWVKIKNKVKIEDHGQKMSNAEKEALKSEKLSEDILNTLRSDEYLMANIEIVPYKTNSWKKGSGLENLPQKIPEYEKYIQHILKFIEKHSDENTYIIMAGEEAAKEEFIKVFNNKSDSSKKIDIMRYKIFSCEMEAEKIKPGNEKNAQNRSCADKCRTAATISLCKWYLDNRKPRKVVLLPGISQRSQYNWLYNDVSHLVSTITTPRYWI